MKFPLLAALFYLAVLAPAAGQSKIIDSLTREVETRSNDTAKVNAYRMLTGMVRTSDPVKAIAYGKEGILLARKLQFEKGLAGCYLNLSAAYIAGYKLDSGLLYIDSAIGLARTQGEPNRLALAYLNRADIHMQLSNLNQSLKDCDTALTYAEQANNDDRRARIIQTIGSVYYTQNKYTECIPYYEKALQLYERVNARQMSAVVLNNLGNTYKYLGQYDKSIAQFQKAIDIADSLGNTANQLMYHSNLGDVYLTKGDYAAAEKSFTLAMEYAVQQENEHQQAIAFSHFANLYLKQEKYPQAIQAAAKAYAIMKKDGDIFWQQDAADLLARGYSNTGDFKKAFEFQKISKELNDSLVRQQFDDEIAAMQTTYKVEEKNKEIQLLSKDGQIKQAQLSKQRILLIASIALLTVTCMAIVLLVNRNRMRQRVKELELRNTIAADLHDEVGSSLSSIHMLSQMARKQQMNTGDILEKVSTNAHETMEKMSDIVWMVKPGDSEAQSLKTRMERFTYELCNARQIECSFSAGRLDELRLSMPQRKNLYLIFKEAVNNAVKYSGTHKLDVNIGIEQRHLVLQIKDYGKGFDEKAIVMGNGLNNMQHRTKELRGVLSVSSQPENGTEVSLSFPV